MGFDAIIVVRKTDKAECRQQCAFVVSKHDSHRSENVGIVDTDFVPLSFM